MNAFSELIQHVEQFQALPPEALVKQDILRLGLRFSEAAMSLSAFKPKDYFIFSFDLVEIKKMQAEEHRRVPEEIRISGGNLNLRPTVISVRINPLSPYLVDIQDNQLRLSCEGQILADVEYHPLPDFYFEKLKSGKPMGEMTPVLEWGYLIYLTAYRMCQYFNKDEQCQFCDINRNFVQQRKAGKPYTGIKDPEEIVEALGHIDRLDTKAKAYTLTGGSIITDLQGTHEVDFYVRYVEAIEARFPKRWISKAVVQAFEVQDCQRLKDAGVQIYHPNYEVWGEELFSKICPGKTRVIGFERWINRVVESAQVFGAPNVIPNFVGGVEMNTVCGFSDVDRAIDHTAEGLDWFMSRGIVPRFTTWCPEPLAALGPQPAPPLAYFAKLLLRWREIFHHYGHQPPPGYGQPGPGKAVFSVSAFMDVLEPTNEPA
ncbi:MAG: radical SAM protein [Acidobacteria bacterium]|nr:radical SAM protein [Acidobacteriota bacterium]MCB9398824.1 radical SAM protein [Acidobacteriota bacterium]